MPGIYSYNSSEMLFKKLVRDFSTFYKNPSEDGLFTVVFPLYHLREWICPGGHENYKGKQESELTNEERLHKTLYDMKEYSIVRDLCNNAKHFNKADLDSRTNQLPGFRAGLGRAGDSLGVIHFLVDGVELRDIFWPIYNMYVDYFKSLSLQLNRENDKNRIP